MGIEELTEQDCLFGSNRQPVENIITTILHVLSPQIGQ